jgi:hypothetical protein
VQQLVVRKIDNVVIINTDIRQKIKNLSVAIKFFIDNKKELSEFLTPFMMSEMETEKTTVRDYITKLLEDVPNDWETEKNSVVYHTVAGAAKILLRLSEKTTSKDDLCKLEDGIFCPVIKIIGK